MTVWNFVRILVSLSALYPTWGGDSTASTKAKTAFISPPSPIEGDMFLVTCDSTIVALDPKVKNVTKLEISRSNNVTDYIAVYYPGKKLTVPPFLIRDWVVYESTSTALDPELEMPSLTAIKVTTRKNDSGVYACSVQYKLGLTYFYKTFKSIVMVQEATETNRIVEKNVLWGQWFTMQCDSTHGRLMTSVPAMLTLQLLFSPDCAQYRIIGQIISSGKPKPARAWMKGYLTRKNWRIDMSEDRRPSHKNVNATMKLTAYNVSEGDGGCFQCLARYTFPKRISSSTAKSKQILHLLVKRDSENDVLNSGPNGSYNYYPYDYSYESEFDENDVYLDITTIDAVAAPASPCASCLTLVQTLLIYVIHVLACQGD
ncbi:uncharacterized protein LOC131954549 [Physella acuta]|uniref:uncharacterized protein LOC131954549 n=1 Tax=Physella acuta TaxID=109671 RepID=UPI0027DE1636|nr:uncharacterized protein LOC131954549 [Physella acuta]